jgi:TFIIF-interacting CTD phosphatase-like protein|tara:strand:- start:1924 stop:2169 length:246 start_codon:yes stop_codon:yes gene_type:complete
MKKGIPVKSERKGKKFKVLTPAGKIIHFGDSSMKDFTQHKDKKRRESYCARSAGIRDKNGKLTKDDPESANYYSRKFLWKC